MNILNRFFLVEWSHLAYKFISCLIILVHLYCTALSLHNFQLLVLSRLLDSYFILYILKLFSNLRLILQSCRWSFYLNLLLMFLQALYLVYLAWCDLCPRFRLLLLPNEFSRIITRMVTSILWLNELNLKKILKVIYLSNRRLRNAWNLRHRYLLNFFWLWRQDQEFFASCAFLSSLVSVFIFELFQVLLGNLMYKFWIGYNGNFQNLFSLLGWRGLVLVLRWSESMTN